jgi:hypothetical protein
MRLSGDDICGVFSRSAHVFLRFSLRSLLREGVWGAEWEGTGCRRCVFGGYMVGLGYWQARNISSYY